MTSIPLCPQATHPKAWNLLFPEGSSLDSSPFITPHTTTSGSNSEEQG